MPIDRRTVYLAGLEYQGVPLLKFGLSVDPFRRFDELALAWGGHFETLFMIDCNSTALTAAEIERRFRRDVPMTHVMFQARPIGWTEVFLRSPEAEAAAMTNLRKLARGALVPAPVEESTEETLIKPHHVYLVDLGRDNAYKIGRTNGLKRRMSMLGRANPWIKLVTSAEIGSEQDAKEAEQYLLSLAAGHEFMDADYEGREIFTLDDDVLHALIMSINHMKSEEEMGGAIP